MSFDDMNPNPYRKENPGFYFWRSVKIVLALILGSGFLFALITYITVRNMPNLYELSPDRLTNERCDSELGSNLVGFKTEKCIAVFLDSKGVIAVGTLSPELKQQFKSMSAASDQSGSVEYRFKGEGSFWYRISQATPEHFVVSYGSDRFIRDAESTHEKAKETARNL